MSALENKNLLTRSVTLFNASQKTWFICLLIAQVFFVLYLALGYGFTGIESGMSAWSRFNDTAYIENDTLGNSIYAAHVLLAIVMIIGGSLQLIPTIRQRFRRFHRINGRVFVALACTISMAGLYLIIVRGTVGNALLHSLTSFAGFVVLMSSIFAIKAAINRDFERHKIWAIRLYLAANGVLFFRLVFFAWLMVFGTLGINIETFTGPTVVTISVCAYVLPIFIAELSRYASTSPSANLKLLCSALLFIISAVFLIGLFGLVMGNWYPAIFG